MDKQEVKGQGPGPGQRKPYTKPQLTQIELRPEEAVLANCKISSASGPATSDCGTFVCSSVGS